VPVNVDCTSLRMSVVSVGRVACTSKGIMPITYLGLLLKVWRLFCMFAYWSFYLLHYNYFGAFMFANDIAGTKDLGDHFAIGITSYIGLNSSKSFFSF